MEADFGGYATKAGLKCSDGRTIMPDAFKHMDGMTVPLVWRHMKNDPKNVLGHGVLEARTDGMYVHGFFNQTELTQKIAFATTQHELLYGIELGRQSKDTVSQYVNPNFRRMFYLAFFFTVMHVLVMIVATAPKGHTLFPVAYIGIGVLAMVMLFRK